jgi:hypothetical protein
VRPLARARGTARTRGRGGGVATRGVTLVWDVRTRHMCVGVLAAYAGNRIGDDGARVLAAAGEKSASLTTLILSSEPWPWLLQHV